MILTLGQVCNPINAITKGATDAIAVKTSSQNPQFKYVQVTEYTHQVSDDSDEYTVSGSILRPVVEGGLPANAINVVRLNHGEDESFDPAKARILAVARNVVYSSDESRFAIDVLKDDEPAPETLDDWLWAFDSLGTRHYGCDWKHLQCTKTYAVFHLANGKIFSLKFKPTWSGQRVVESLANVVPNATPVLVQFIDEIFAGQPMNWNGGENYALLHLVEGETGLHSMLSGARNDGRVLNNLLWKNYTGKRGEILFDKLTRNNDEFIINWDNYSLNMVGYEGPSDKQGLTEVRRMTFAGLSKFNWFSTTCSWIRREIKEVWTDATLVGVIIDPAEKAMTACFGPVTTYHPANPDAWQAMLQMALANANSDENDSVIVIKKHKSLRKYFKIKDCAEATLDEVMEQIRTRAIVPVHFQVEKGGNEVILHVVDFA